MSIFKLEIKLDNAAYRFVDELDPFDELVRNLKAVSKELDNECWNGRIRDNNGNIVGNWSIEE